EQVGFLIRERFEWAGNPFEKTIRQARIPCEHRPVQIGADDAALYRAVHRVAVLGAPATQWLRIWAGLGDAPMVFETEERDYTEHAALDGDVADEPLRRARRVRIQ